MKDLIDFNSVEPPAAAFDLHSWAGGKSCPIRQLLGRLAHGGRTAPRKLVEGALREVKRDRDGVDNLDDDLLLGDCAEWLEAALRANPRRYPHEELPPVPPSAFAFWQGLDLVDSWQPMLNGGLTAQELSELKPRVAAIKGRVWDMLCCELTGYTRMCLEDKLNGLARLLEWLEEAEEVIKELD